MVLKEFTFSRLLLKRLLISRSILEFYPFNSPRPKSTNFYGRKVVSSEQLVNVLGLYNENSNES